MDESQEAKAIERFQSAKEFAEDYKAYCDCRDILKRYNRQRAICLLNSLLKRYWLEIDQFGILFDGTYVKIGENYDNAPDSKIIDNLIYVGDRIYIYALIREGDKQLAKVLFNKIGSSGSIL